MNCLVDTAIWSLAFRRQHHLLSQAERMKVSALSELVKDGRAQIIGLIRQELLSGIKSSEQFEKLRFLLRSFQDEPLEDRDYEEAARASNDCRARGIASSGADMLICAVSISRSWSIFTSDVDFENYAKVLPINLYDTRS